MKGGSAEREGGTNRLGMNQCLPFVTRFSFFIPSPPTFQGATSFRSFGFGAERVELGSQGRDREQGLDESGFRSPQANQLDATQGINFKVLKIRNEKHVALMLKAGSKPRAP